MQDIELTNVLARSLGLTTNEKGATDEKLGEDRLGDGSFYDTIGFSILLVSAALLLILIVILLVICISKRCSQSAKWHERRLKLREYIFYTPLLRYMILNALKLNISATLALKAVEGSLSNRIVGYALMLFMLITPAVLSWILWYQHL